MSKITSKLTKKTPERCQKDHFGVCNFGTDFKNCSGVSIVNLNPFWANVPILHDLKIPESPRGVFRGYEMGTFARNGLSKLMTAEKLLKSQYLCV